MTDAGPLSQQSKPPLLFKFKKIYHEHLLSTLRLINYKITYYFPQTSIIVALRIMQGFLKMAPVLQSLACALPNCCLIWGLGSPTKKVSI